MSKNTFSKELFNKAPIVGIVRNLTLDEVTQILPIYREAGLTTIEITMNTPGAEDIIRYALEHESEGLNIGAFARKMIWKMLWKQELSLLLRRLLTRKS
jgi:2-dehydro-3-deoxyphosphogluconate aldolase/(4S)-4-hydroxy-2-oxoglutarate aldolase